MSTLDQTREYERTHPWISFSLDTNRLPVTTWIRLGEAASKMDHIAGVPLTPEIARSLHTLYITRGVQGTTAIEGNTLSEDQVKRAVEGDLEVPPSQEYLRQEVVNIAEACQKIADRAATEGAQPISVDWILKLNEMTLHKLDPKEGVVPGKTRDHSVGVALYRGAPWQDCEHLLERLCDWLNDPVWSSNPTFSKSFAIIRAIMAHLYLAWIHPFGDGNGRTARLLEFQLLIEGGAPTPAAHLLSNHFNITRDRYYRELDKTSKSGPPYPVESFIDYALEGFVDGLREQLKLIRDYQTGLVWENFVHESVTGHTEAAARRRTLLLELPPNTWTKRSEIIELTPKLALAYAGKTHKTLTRDLNELTHAKLIERKVGNVRPRIDLLRAFLPLRVT